MSFQPKNRASAPDENAGSLPGEQPGGVSTGSLGLDLSLGTDGWPRGHIVEIVGGWGTGKTTLVLEAVARAQRNGGLGALIDADHAANGRAARRLGIDLDRMPYHRTNVLEDAFEKIDELVQGGAVDVIALDSIAALLPEGSLKCDRSGVPPRKDEEHLHRVDFFLRSLLGPLSRSRATLLITNQWVEKAGVYFGNPETTPWVTHPLPNYATQRVELRRVGAIKRGDDHRGFEIEARVTKNRLNAPFVKVRFELLFASGICRESELLQCGAECGLVSKRGQHLSFGGTSLGNGRDEAESRLRQDMALASRLRDEILERMRQGSAGGG